MTERTPLEEELRQFTPVPAAQDVHGRIEAALSKPQQNVPISQYQKDQAGQSMMAANPTDQKAKTNDAVGAMAAEDMPLAAPEAAPVTPGEGDDDVEIVDVLKAIIMRLQAIEEKIGAGAAAPGQCWPPRGCPPRKRKCLPLWRPGDW